MYESVAMTDKDEHTKGATPMVFSIGGHCVAHMDWIVSTFDAKKSFVAMHHAQPVRQAWSACM